MTQYKVIYVPSRIVFGFCAVGVGLFLTLTLAFGHWISDGGWPTPGRFWVSVATVLICSGYSFLHGFRGLSGLISEGNVRIGIRGSQSVIVVLLLIAFSGYFAWLLL